MPEISRVREAATNIALARCATDSPRDPPFRPTGKRDFAMLLLLATYGLGAAEILGLRLEDLNWSAGVLKACRPKTKVAIELPLLPSVARALTAYLRLERPPAKGISHSFNA